MKQDLLKKPAVQEIVNTVKCPHCRRKHIVPEQGEGHAVILCACGTTFCVTAGYRSAKTAPINNKKAQPFEFQKKAYPVGHPALISAARFANAATNRLKR